MPSPTQYRFGFILSTALGNITHYTNLRKYAERDQTVEFTWAPVTHYIAPGEPGPWRKLPGPLYERAVVLHQMGPVFSKMQQFDAVMIHQFEASLLAAARSYFKSSPTTAYCSDAVPAIRSDYPLYPRDANKPAWRRRVRLEIDLWRSRRSDILIPFSQWAADILTQDCGIAPQRVCAQPVGLDLDHWPRVVKSKNAKPNLLFVGGDFERKGGDLLLDVFTQLSADQRIDAELHLVSAQAPDCDHPQVHVYRDLTPNSPQLRQLYQTADLMVLPTTADLSPWVFLEAMASGCAVVGTRVGGIPELIREGETGFVIEKGNSAALADMLPQLLSQPDRLGAMGQAGRAWIETHYNAAVNVPKILQVMKTAADARRAASAPAYKMG